MLFYLGIAVVVALWVLLDAHGRKSTHPFLWSLGTFMFLILVLPFYFAKRPLVATEVREGGVGWNVTKYFALVWTLFMFLVGLEGMTKMGEFTSTMTSDAEIAGASIGIFLGMGMIGGIWFFGVSGALVVGLFLKKSSIVEVGPTPLPRNETPL